MTNPNDTARLYAAFKMLERMLKDDGELPPGFYADVSGDEVTIKFPKGTVVERDRGTNGNGTILKKSVQNAYGYAAWALFIERLQRFHQWQTLRQMLLEALTEAVQGNGSVRDRIRNDHPQTVALMDELQQMLPIPPRTEQTPRICKDPGIPATITIKKAAR